MGRSIKNYGKLTKDYILSNVSQITIFSTYLNISDKIIKYCIDTGDLIKSPLRNDIHPTCGFRYDKKGKLKFRDFAGYFWGDCFDLVAYIISYNYNKPIDVNNKKDFIKILTHITFVFKDIFYGKEKDINLLSDIDNSISKIKNSKNIIEIVSRNWNEDDENYWGQFGITLKDLNINFVVPVDQFYINRKINPQPKYNYDKDDPCYSYILGQDKQGIYNIKLYFPNRDKSYTRFICNCNHLEGIYQLERNDYDVIIITKSTKDRIAMNSAIKRYNSLYGEGLKINIGVINIPHETYHLKPNEYVWLESKTKDGFMISFMDNDNTGKLEAKWLRDKLGITPFIIPKTYKAKDFSELVKITDNKSLATLITQFLMWVDEKRIQFIKNKRDSSIIPY